MGNIAQFPSTPLIYFSSGEAIDTRQFHMVQVVARVPDETPLAPYVSFCSLILPCTVLLAMEDLQFYPRQHAILSLLPEIEPRSYEGCQSSSQPSSHFPFPEWCRFSEIDFALLREKNSNLIQMGFEPEPNLDFPHNFDLIS